MSALLKLRNSRGLTQKEVAETLGISRVNYTNIENGKRGLTMENAIKLAKLYGVSIDQLLNDANAVVNPPFTSVTIAHFHDPEEEIKMIYQRHVPVLQNATSCDEKEFVENRAGWAEVSEPMAQLGLIFGLIVNGDSMSPIFLNGDIAIVLKTEKIINNSCAVVRINGDPATIKKVRVFENGLELIPINSNYGAKQYSNSDIRELPVTIIGQVIDQTLRHRMKTDEEMRAWSEGSEEEK